MKSKITGQVSQSIKAPVSKVWEALITPGLVKRYFFGTCVSSDWKIGSPVIFTGEWQGKKYEDKGIVLEVEPDKLLRFTYWSSMSGIEDKSENYVVITYELEEENKYRTTLTVTQENIPDEKTKEHSQENWKKVLDNLKKLLEKEPVSPL